MKILITGGNGNIAKIVKNNLSEIFDIINPSHKELDILDFNKLKEFLSENSFDILIHTAILGGRRTNEDSVDVVYKNLMMLENLLKFSENFKMIINLDSAAIYDRNTDILNRKEEELFTVPNDYYGFSKYIIYKRSLNYSHFYNFRIFNIFHPNEESSRFIKSCFLAKKNNTDITIYEDKFFDFVYENDFITIVRFYLDNINNAGLLEKTINICYEKKYKLSDIAIIVINNNDKINIINKNSINNYCGNNLKLKNINIDLLGLEKSLIIYETKYLTQLNY
jgi:nucleoside-diphosphate-sugar epimerase